MQRLESGLQVPSGHQVDPAAFVQQPSSNRLKDRVDLLQCLIDEGQGTVNIATGIRGSRGPLKHLHAIHPGPRLGIGDPGP
jgi:hypothetical protein